MNIEVVLLPSLLEEQTLHGKTAVVIDVIRATTTIAAALAGGVTSVRAFGSFAEAQNAASGLSPRPILCGEVKALPPPGADLGNSPRQWKPEHAGKQVFLATTNGTRAIIAARAAKRLLVAAMVNRAAVCEAIRAIGNDVVVICSGSSGRISLDDTVCAGSICEYLTSDDSNAVLEDTGRIARELFLRNEKNLPGILKQSQAGKNVIAVDLEGDVDFAARLDCLKVVGGVEPNALIITDIASAHGR